MNNYTITFVSLRAGTVYTLSIGGGTGTAIPLKGAAQPFTTQEDDTDDMFTPVRTQSGYIRIVDDGKDANGNSFDWRDLIPATGTSRPVVLSHVEGGNTIVDWMGYIQPQNFSGVLYGGTQEREFPVYCGLSGLQNVTLADMGTASAPVSFAFTLYRMFYQLPSIQFTTFAVQGGDDAREWLMKKMDWRNFYNADGTPSYNAAQIFEEICKFWGWTARTDGQTVYLTCMDDETEQNWLMLDISELQSLTASSGTVDQPASSIQLTGDIFVSTDNDETVEQGVKSAVVKSDVNKADAIIKFAPKDLEDYMGDPSIWVADQDTPGMGYYRTATKYSLDGQTMKAMPYTSSVGGFERRTIFSSADSENSSKVDSILIRREPVTINDQMVPIIYIETKNVMTFSQGSLAITAQLFNGAKSLDLEDKIVWARLGIGMSRETAKWFYLNNSNQHSSYYDIASGWDTTPQPFALYANNGQLNGAFIWGVGSGIFSAYLCKFPLIPVAAALYGYLYLDILGMPDVSSFEIANLEVTFSRVQTFLPTRSDQPRPRTVNGDSDTEHEFVSTGDTGAGSTWNADLIFASDYGIMEYGYGLLMNANGSFMETVPYNDDTDYEFAEQHLANRVATYWQTSRRRMTLQLNAADGDVADVSPLTNVTVDGGIYYPVSISRNWWDDVKSLTLMEIPST